MLTSIYFCSRSKIYIQLHLLHFIKGQTAQIFFLIQSPRGYCKSPKCMGQAGGCKEDRGSWVTSMFYENSFQNEMKKHMLFKNVLYLFLWSDVFFIHDLCAWLVVLRAVLSGWLGKIWSRAQILFFLHIHTRKTHKDKIIYSSLFCWK